MHLGGSGIHLRERDDVLTGAIESARHAHPPGWAVEIPDVRQRPAAVLARAAVSMNPLASVRCVWLTTSVADAQINAIVRMIEVAGRPPTVDELRARGKGSALRRRAADLLVSESRCWVDPRIRSGPETTEDEILVDGGQRRRRRHHHHRQQHQQQPGKYQQQQQARIGRMDAMKTLASGDGHRMIPAIAVGFNPVKSCNPVPCSCSCCCCFGVVGVLSLFVSRCRHRQKSSFTPSSSGTLRERPFRQRPPHCYVLRLQPTPGWSIDSSKRPRSGVDSIVSSDFEIGCRQVLVRVPRPRAHLPRLW